VKDEKDIKIIGLVALLPVVLAYGFADAMITATSCVTCHTMHNSQGGTVVVSAGPQEALVNKAGVPVAMRRILPAT